MKLTNTRAHNNTAYNVATGVAAVDAEEGLDQITGLPNQLLAIAISVRLFALLSLSSLLLLLFLLMFS